MRCSLLRGLGGFPEQARTTLPILFEAANDSTTEVRLAAIISIGELKSASETVVPFLILLLDDSNSRVRYESAEALGEFGELAESALPSLTLLLKDEASGSGGCMAMPVSSGARNALMKIRPQAVGY